MSCTFLSQMCKPIIKKLKKDSDRGSEGESMDAGRQVGYDTTAGSGMHQASRYSFSIGSGLRIGGQRHGLQGKPELCKLCLQELQITDHLLILCVYIKQV